ncbi:MAG TPA: hypothetical protein P5060_04315, partial [Candidatus Absconditabacterales bacterium]|nr:hypothetical protein [Candidatus Absconditabacterales bacterium]
MDQIKNREDKVKEGLIIPAKGKFSRTLTKEILQSKLYKNLQRSIGNIDYFFHINKSKLKKGDKIYNREIYNTLTDTIIIDKDKIPPKFIEEFNLDINSENLEQQVKNIFKKARFLGFDGSHRIVFVDDKIIIFRNEERLVHKNEDRKLTQGEKRRTEIFTTFNTFNNIYDATRSQYHTLKQQKESIDENKILQKELQKLTMDIKLFFQEGSKQYFVKNNIENILEDIKNIRNSKEFAAKIQNLEQVTFKNRSVDSNLVTGAENKFRKRFNDLVNMNGIISKHLNLLEKIENEYNSNLDYLLTQLKFTDKGLSLSNYFNSYDSLHKNYGDIEPFATFHRRIKKYQSQDEDFKKIIKHIELFWDMYKQEDI